MATAAGSKMGALVWPAGAEAEVVEIGPAFFVEALFTLILVWVVLNTDDAKKIGA